MINKKLSPLLLEMEELVNKQDEEEFLFFINNYQDELLKEDPVAFISFHVDFYALKDDITKTLEVVNYYKNAPYISMEVEDMLNELKTKLERYRDSQNKGPKSKSNDELERELFSNNENAIASALTYLSKQNINIISGLAKGIDTYAHKGAVENKKNTIAVMGNGLDVVYPKENIRLI